MMDHLGSFVSAQIWQFPLYEEADGREMRMDIHQASSLCHTFMLGHAGNTLLLVGDPSSHNDRSDVLLAKHKCPHTRVIKILC